MKKQLEEKLKADRLLYKATTLDGSATPSTEQSINNGNRSSDNKDNASDSEKQRKQVIMANLIQKGIPKNEETFNKRKFAPVIK